MSLTAINPDQQKYLIEVTKLLLAYSTDSPFTLLDFVHTTLKDDYNDLKFDFLKAFVKKTKTMTADQLQKTCVLIH